MTHRERMLAAIQGKLTDQIPWAPRMDLWCIAVRERGTMPPEFAGLNPSIEQLSRIFCRAFMRRIHTPNLTRIRVQLWENDIAWSAYEQRYTR